MSLLEHDIKFTMSCLTNLHLLCIRMSAVEAPEVIEVTLRRFGNGTFLLSLQFDQQVSTFTVWYLLYMLRKMLVKINFLLQHLECILGSVTLERST